MLLLAVLAGCAVEIDRWAEVDPDLEVTLEGAYDAEVHLEVVARLGPVPLGRAACDEPITLVVRGGDVSGAVTCELPEVGRVTATLSGAVDAPWIEGLVEAQGDEIPWQGAFTAPDAFFGEIEGTVREQGLTVRYTGWFEADRDGGFG